MTERWFIVLATRARDRAASPKRGALTAAGVTRGGTRIAAATIVSLCASIVAVAVAVTVADAARCCTAGECGSEELDLLLLRNARAQGRRAGAGPAWRGRRFEGALEPV